MQQKKFNQLEKKIEVSFKNPDLLRQAFVHRSYLNEHRDFDLDHNERLEFLGDAVLELVVTESMYRQYPNPEGELTNWRASLVNSQTLSVIATELGFGDYLYLSRGEAQDTGKARNSILANTFEAVVGAIFLDQGMTSAEAFIRKHVLSRLEDILKEKAYIDPKSRFQEASQKMLGVTPVYRVLKEEGPDHLKSFTVGLYIDDELVATGDGSSKQEAQVNAASNGLAIKGW